MGKEKRKGRLLEDVVALLHEQAGTRIDVRVRLRVIGGARKCLREIDVLLTSDVCGYPVRIAIECKNEVTRIGEGKIDAFVGKLQHVGIPPVHGIFVSSRGYTKDALERAKAAGIRPLVLEGLTADRLGVEISEARQSMVYVLATWRNMNYMPWVPDVTKCHPPGISAHLDLSRHGQGEIGLQNVLWELWITREIPDLLGKHTVSIHLPTGFSLTASGTDDGGGLVIIDYEVTGHMWCVKGRSRSLRLRNAGTGILEKERLDAAFDRPDAPIDLVCLHSEDDLRLHLASGELQVHGRVRVPRIVGSTSYWPPSKQMLQRIRELRASGSDVCFASVEGIDLSRAWEAWAETNDS